MSYTSARTGPQNDQYETRIAQLELQVSGLQTLVSTNASHIQQLQQEVTQYSNHSITKVYYSSTYSDGSAVTCDYRKNILFDHVIIDTNNNFDLTSGAVVVSDTGLYLVNWTTDSYASTTSNAYYGTITHLDSNNNILEYNYTNAIPKGCSLTNIYSAIPGDKFIVGGTTAGPVSQSTYFKAGKNYNEFTVYRIQ